MDLVYMKRVDGKSGSYQSIPNHLMGLMLFATLKQFLLTETLEIPTSSLII